MQLESFSRRAITAALLAVPLATPAFAFDNALPGREERAAAKKTPGPPPTGIGYRLDPKARPGALPVDLKPCLDGRPHCFSSTKATTLSGGSTKVGDDWLLPSWTYTGKTQLQALDDIKTAVDKYPPGQKGIDGGGWKVKTFRLPEFTKTADGEYGDVGYLYVQYEAELQGYIDDVEFVVGDGLVNVRTSSRTGYLDYGANAKRYNWLAKEVGKSKGWKITPIRQKEHPGYFEQNDITDADVEPEATATPAAKTAARR